MSAKPIARLCDCKGTKKNVYEQKKEYFLLSSCVYSKKLVTLCPHSLYQCATKSAKHGTPEGIKRSLLHGTSLCDMQRE